TSYPDSRPNMVVGGGTSLNVPLLGGGRGLGLIALFRLRVTPFTDREIALAEMFADQAVIAIENARLFQALNDSNASRKEPLLRQTATAEVLAAISRSPTDLAGVLDELVDSAARLCGASGVFLTQIEDGRLRTLAAHGEAHDPFARDRAT